MADATTETSLQEQQSRPLGSLGTALITGAATGIGRALASKMVEAGWAVHICDVDDRAIADFKSAIPGASASVANVADDAQVRDVVKDVLDRYGRLDVLINNAGISGMTAPIEEFDTDDWRWTMDVNVSGSFYFVREVVPAMKRAGRGSIINIASTAALFGYPQRAAYSAAKWAVIGLTKTLAMELGPHGIRVNAVCPGSVEGPRIDGVIARDAAHRGMDPARVRQIYESQVSLRRFVKPDDVANMCVFLASEAASMISGQVIAVDGHTEHLSFPL